jgi:hypothetical protein
MFALEPRSRESPTNLNQGECIFSTNRRERAAVVSKANRREGLSSLPLDLSMHKFITVSGRDRTVRRRWRPANR